MINADIRNHECCDVEFSHMSGSALLESLQMRDNHRVHRNHVRKISQFVGLRARCHQSIPTNHRWWCCTLSDSRWKHYLAPLNRGAETSLRFLLPLVCLSLCDDSILVRRPFVFSSISIHHLSLLLLSTSSICFTFKSFRSPGGNVSISQKVFHCETK